MCQKKRQPEQEQAEQGKQVMGKKIKEQKAELTHQKTITTNSKQVGWKQGLMGKEESWI